MKLLRVFPVKKLRLWKILTAKLKPPEDSNWNLKDFYKIEFIFGEMFINKSLINL